MCALMERTFCLCWRVKEAVWIRLALFAVFPTF
ncbi:hypothetical protein Nmel_012646 [Mimus melanotis]